jgi:hypothetical protein
MSTVLFIILIPFMLLITAAPARQDGGPAHQAPLRPRCI